MLVVSNENSGCDLIFLVSRNRCRDLNLMSRPLFCCDVIQLSYRGLEFRSRPNIFFNHWNSCRNLKKYVATIPSSYSVATSSLSLNSSLQFLYFWSRPDCSAMFWNICHDLDLMSRHQFLLPVMLIFVTTMFFRPFNKFNVTTLVPCRDLVVLFSTTFYVATSELCRDLISVVSH